MSGGLGGGRLRRVPAGEPAAPSGGRTAGRLFVLLSLFYILGTGGHVYTPDGVVMARVTESLVERGELRIEDPGYPAGFLARGRGGASYSKYGVGLPVVAIPGYLVGKLIAAVDPGASAPAFGGLRFLWYDVSDPAVAWRYFGVGLTNALLAAGCGALLYLLALELGYRHRTAWVLALILALASPLWVYSKTFFSEPLATLLLLAFAWSAARWHRTLGTAAAWVGGGMVGLLILVKIAHVVLWPLAGAVVGAALWTSGLGSAEKWRAGLRFLAGPLVGLGVLAGLNTWCFGSPLASGYGDEAARWTTPAWEGITGLLISPGRGLLIYAPWVLLAVVGARVSFRRRPLWTGFGGGVLVVLVALYCRWHGWDGGWTWGPRFLLPALPFLLLVAAPIVEGSGSFARRPWRILVWMLVGGSVVVSAIGALVPTTEYHAALRQMIGAGYLPAARWSWAVWPPWGYLHLPKNYSLAWSAWTAPGGWGLRLAFLALGLVLATLLVRWRRLWTDPGTVSATPEDPTLVG